MVIFRAIRKFRIILSRHQKLRIMEIAVMMVAGGFLEMLSVSLIIPFMNAAMEPEVVMANQYVKLICDLFLLGSYRSFLVFLALVMAVIYMLKNAFLIFQHGVQTRFVYNNMFVTQQGLLHNYLLRPYEFYLNIKSGEVLRIIGTDTASAFNMLTTLLQLFSELVVSTILIATIFFVAPMATLGMAALLGVMLVLMQVVIRPVLVRAGVRNRDSFAGMNQWLLQAIQGIKELKVMHKEKFFENSFSKNGKVYVKTMKEYQTLGVIPRFMIEAICMSAFFVILAIMIYKGQGLEDIVPMLSAVAMAAVRLLPSANRISQSMSALTFGEAALDKMIENLTEANNYSLRSASILSKNTSQIAKMTECVAMTNVSYRYPTGKKNVLDGASMYIPKGESVGIVGMSGAGKTTAVDILLGLLFPSEGNVFIDGVDISTDLSAWQKQIAYIPQSIFMLDGNIRDNVAFGIESDEVDDEKVWRALREAAIDSDIADFPDGLETQIGERGLRLSGGQRQRLGIARALYVDPEILLFDEATSALDNETEAEIIKSIERLHGKKTMVIIAHRPSTIEKCDRVYRVENGKIIIER